MLDLWAHNGRQYVSLCVVGLLLFLAYGVRAAKRFYGRDWLTTLLRSIVVPVGSMMGGAFLLGIARRTQAPRPYGVPTDPALPGVAEHPESSLIRPESVRTAQTGLRCKATELRQAGGQNRRRRVGDSHPRLQGPE